MEATAPDLYAITDRRLMQGGPEAAWEKAFAAGLAWLQVRERDLAPDEQLALARAAVAVARRHRARVLVSDRADLARLAGADGVHLPERGLPVAEVKRAFPGLLVARSVHSPEQARRAGAEGADFVQFGPVFATPGKAGFGPPQGLDRLAAAVRAVGVPVIAVGGIEPGNVPACLEAGARGVAAIRGVWAAPDPGAAVRRYLTALAAAGRNA